jgi:hypothetical protein
MPFFAGKKGHYSCELVVANQVIFYDVDTLKLLGIEI